MTKGSSFKRHCGVDLHRWARGRSSVLHILACFSPIIRGELYRRLGRSPISAR